MNHRLVGVQSATELAELMAAAGLAQNFFAIRALSTEGIQQGHMKLHARCVAASAGAAPAIFDTVVDRSIESGEIKVWKAREIIGEVTRQSKAPAVASAKPSEDKEPLAAGYGKIILFGEHAAVYGRHALAAPVPLAIQAKVADGSEGVEVIIPRWNVETRLHEPVTQRQDRKSTRLNSSHVKISYA